MPCMHCSHARRQSPENIELLTTLGLAHLQARGAERNCAIHGCRSATPNRRLSTLATRSHLMPRTPRSTCPAAAAMLSFAGHPRGWIHHPGLPGLRRGTRQVPRAGRSGNACNDCAVTRGSAHAGVCRGVEQHWHVLFRQGQVCCGAMRAFAARRSARQAIACLKHAAYLAPFEWMVAFNLGPRPWCAAGTHRAQGWCICARSSSRRRSII